MIPEMLILHGLVILIFTIQLARADIAEVASFQNTCNSFLQPKEIRVAKISNASSMNTFHLMLAASAILVPTFYGNRETRQHGFRQH